MANKTPEELIAENEELRIQLEEAQETLNAIRRGEVDGLVISTPKGEQVYTISGAEKPYRVLIEEMREGAVMLSKDDAILYCNRGFADIVKLPSEKLVGRNIENLVSPTFKATFKHLLDECRGIEKPNSLTKGITFITSDNLLVPTQVSVNTLDLENATTTFIVVTDLTKHMEEDLKSYTKDLRNAGIALFESEQRWATTLASIGDAVIATNKTGKIEFMNGVAERLTGWSLAEAKDKSVPEVFKIVNEKTRKIVEDPITRVLNKGMVVGLANHTILIEKDGTEIPIDDSGAPIRGKDNEINGVVLIFRDITERRRTENEILDQKNRAERYLNVVGNIILALDPQGKITLLNKTGYKILGYKEGELTGKDWVETCLPQKIRPQLRKFFDDWVQGRIKIPENNENYILTKDGKERCISWHNSEIRNEEGQIIGTLSSGEDITERKQIETKLEEYREHLEKLVEERTRELQSKERFAAIGATAGMVGHDIRNPLQAITGDLYLAREDLKEMPNCEKRKALEESLNAIEENVFYINKIVSDLQDYTRPLKPTFEKVKIKELIASIVAETQIPANIETNLIADETLVFNTDASYIRRALTNLLVNAIQAMPKGGKITMEAQLNQDAATLTVTDTGVGIPDSIKPNLFTPLFTTKAKGQGLGLAVVKRLIDSLNGSITFSSKVEKGTTFNITLPQNPQKTVS